MSNSIRDFVKHSLQEYYKAQQLKMANEPAPEDQNPAIKIVGDGSVYVYGVGGYNGTNIDESMSLQKAINMSSILGSENIDVTDNVIKAKGYQLGNNNGFIIKNYDNDANIDASKSGSFAGGHAATNGIIKSSADGAFAYGYASKGQLWSNDKGTHVEGYIDATGKWIYAYGEGAHAEGYAKENSIEAKGKGAHAEGGETRAGQDFTHAEGYRTHADSSYSHAEGYGTNANELYSHVEGYYTAATGIASHAEGYATNASTNYSHVEGIYNVPHTNSIHITGIGNSNKRQNAFEIDTIGNVYILGVGKYDGSILNNASTLLKTISNISSSVSTINLTVGTLSSSVSNINTSVGNINTSVGNISSSVSNISSSVSNIKNTVTTLSSSVSYLNTYKANYEAGEMDHEDLMAWYSEEDPQYTEYAFYNIIGDYITVSYKNLGIIGDWGEIFYSLPMECEIPAHGVVKSSVGQMVYWSVEYLWSEDYGKYLSVIRLAPLYEDLRFEDDRTTSITLTYKYSPE